MDTLIRKAEGFTHEIHWIIPPPLVKSLAQFPLTSGLYATAIGYFPQAKYHFRKRPHGCEDTILIYCAQGQGWFQINDTRRPLKQYECTLLPAQESHVYGADETMPWTIYWAHLQGSQTATYVNTLMQNNAIAQIHASLTEPVTTLFKQTFQSLDQGMTFNALIHTSSILTHLLSTLFFANPSFMPGVSQPQHRAIEKAIHYMNAHVHAPITLTELATQADLSVPHFSRLFKLKTGASPMDFFSHIKIQRACQHLITTEQNIKQIAKTLGYSDPYYFSRAFKKIMGVSPDQYRKQF